MRWSILSNSAYLAPAILAWGTPLSVACILLALGSAWYHWKPEAYWSHHADEWGMYATSGALVLLGAGIDSWFVALLVFAGAFLVAFHFGSGEILPVLGSFILGGMLVRELYAEMALSAGVFGVSLWIRDPNPDGHRHGWWHLGSAGLIGMLWWFLS